MFAGPEVGALKAYTSYCQQLRLRVQAMAVNKPRQRKYFASLRLKRKIFPLVGHWQRSLSLCTKGNLA
jgi:hypothetical protein